MKRKHFNEIKIQRKLELKINSINQYIRKSKKKFIN